MAETPEERDAARIVNDSLLEVLITTLLDQMILTPSQVDQILTDTLTGAEFGADDPKVQRAIEDRVNSLRAGLLGG